MTMTLILEDDLTHDAFLGGALNIRQPRKGYRAGVDPVLLAASVAALPGQSVLELGCGVGVASLCLQRRVGGLALVGLEIQAVYAELARRNALENSLALEVLKGDLCAMPRELRDRSFDHVIANPPYFGPGVGTGADDEGRETGRREAVPLSEWIDAATRRLRPKGYLTMIQRADRLPDLLAACDSRLGDLRVLPLAARLGRPAELVLLRARKGARGRFLLLSPRILHEGAAHDGDRESYTGEISEILRNGRQLTVE